MEQALCERQFTLHRQQPEKYKQNIDVSPHEKIPPDAHEKRFGTIVTKVCRSLLYASALRLALQQR